MSTQPHLHISTCIQMYTWSYELAATVSQVTSKCSILKQQLFITLQNLGIRNPRTTQPVTWLWVEVPAGCGLTQGRTLVQARPGGCVWDASPLQCWAESLTSCLAGGYPEFLGCLQWLTASSLSSIYVSEQDRARPKTQPFCNLVSNVASIPFIAFC